MQKLTSGESGSSLSPHLLRDIDVSVLTAYCSGCGSVVDIYAHTSRSGFQCGPYARLKAKLWREANPERAAATKQAYRDADPEKFLAQKRVSSAKYSVAHRQEIRDKANKQREQQRAEVIEAYGGQCSCPGCHVAHAVLLTVDHVHGGAHHRQNRRSTRDIYREIIKLGFPSDYQLLCGSCNLAKADKDKCPLAGQDH